MELPSQECGPFDPTRERHRARVSVRTLLVTAAALLMISGPALAADTICTGPLDPAGSPYGNVLVPAGESCTISGVRVDGNVTVHGDLTVTALPVDTTIGGNISTKDGCGTVLIVGFGVATAPEPAPAIGLGRVVIGGNVTIDHCQKGGGVGAGEVTAPTVDGAALPPVVLIGKNLKCSNNGGVCVVNHTVVGGNLELSRNLKVVRASVNFVGGNLTAANNGSGVELQENAIGGDLKCNGNVGPVTEVGNIVAGARRGQCATP